MKTHTRNYFEVCDKQHLVAFPYNTLEEAKKAKKKDEIVVCVVHEKMVEDDGTFFSETISKNKVNVVDFDVAVASLNRVLEIPEARELIDLIEELIGETEPRKVEIRDEYIRELEEKYGYKYEL